jgi:hypothetical protein
MQLFSTFRDAETSLWQSALDAAAAPPAVSAAAPAPAHPLAPLGVLTGNLLARLKHLAAVVPAAEPLGPVAVAATAAVSAAGAPEQARLGAAVVEMARNFTGDAGRFRSALTVRFGHLDPLWLEAAALYYSSLLGRRLLQRVPYTPPRPDDFVLDTLPDPARVALFADWGTGTPEAYELLKQVIARRPDVLIHLGDIYYSGLDREVEGRFLTPLRRAFEELGVRPIPTFSLCGNHDMYCGGEPYYRLLTRLGQPASCFCLRNASWQLVAVDTGHNSGILPADETWLEDAEVQWLRGRVAGAGGRKTVLLSHHQLFSAYETIGTQGDGLNHRLYEQVAPVLGGVARWFWGHEHDLTVYKEHRGVTARCIGHGAVPVTEAGRPKKIAGVEIEAEAAQLGMTGPFYNHGYVILELDGPRATASYFQDAPGAPESWPAESF